VSDANPTTEISLRDVYLLLYRWRIAIVLVPLGLALATFVVSTFWPKTYSSKVVVSLSLANQTSQQGILNNLPSLTGLAQGFVDLQSTTLLSKDLGVGEPPRIFTARFDDRKGLLNLSAKGSSREQAQRRAERILNVARNYLRERMVEGASSNIRAILTQKKLDLQAAKESLKRIQTELASAPERGQSNATIAAGLEARQVDPQAARTASPAFTSLSLDESRLRSSIAQLGAEIDTLNQFLKEPDSINQLVGQALQVQILVPPAEPLRPTSPRPVLYTAIAGVLGLLLSLLWAFIAEAIRPNTEARTPASKQEIEGKTR